MKLNFKRILMPLMIFCIVLAQAQKNVENIDGVYKGKGAVFTLNKNKTKIPAIVPQRIHLQA